jgi:hypothetical protein
MAQIVIDGVLFSPVLAHSLEPGDLVTDADGNSRPWRTPRVQRHDGVVFIEFDTTGGVLVGFNAPVLRAVGARAARGGAR